MCRLPSIDVKELLREEGRHDSAPSEGLAGQALESPLCGLYIFVLDVDFANTGVVASAAGTRNLDLENGTIVPAALFDVLTNFWMVS
jgi:hypothetical protein